MSSSVIFVNKPCLFQCSVQIGEHDCIISFDHTVNNSSTVNAKDLTTWSTVTYEVSDTQNA